MSQSSDTFGLGDWIFIDKFYTYLLGGKSYFCRTAKLNGENECIYHFHRYKVKRNWNLFFVSRDVSNGTYDLRKKVAPTEDGPPIPRKGTQYWSKGLFFSLRKFWKVLFFFLPEWKPKQNRHAILQSCLIRDTCLFPPSYPKAQSSQFCNAVLFLIATYRYSNEQPPAARFLPASDSKVY